MSEIPERDNTSEKQDKSIGAVLGRLGPAAWLGIAWAVMPGVMGIVLLTNMERASEFLLARSEHGGSELLVGVAMYVGIFILTAGIGMLPTYSQAILAGYAFGIAWGFPAALVGFTGASIIGYFIAATIARDRVEAEIHHHPKAEIVRDAFVKHGFLRAMGILILLRIPPTSPFSLMNGIMSVSGVRLVPYVIATAIGMAPRTFAAVWIGSGVSDWSEQSKPRWMIISGIVLTVIVVIILGQFANKAIARATGGSGGSEPNPNAD